MKLDQLLQRKKLRRVLGLALEGGRLAAVELGLRDGAAQIERTALFELAEEPLKGDAQALGTQLRGQLDQAGLQTRDCVLCVPLKWILMLRVELPEIPEADVANFLQLRAEREFPIPPAELSISIVRGESTDGRKYAVLCAIPLRQITKLQEVIRLAGLRLLSVTTQLAALRKSGIDENSVALLLTHDAVEMGVFGSREPLVLRSLESSHATEPEGRLDFERLVRELRITLGQLPQFGSAEHNAMFVFSASAEELGAFAGESGRFDRLGLKFAAGQNVLNTYLSKDALAGCAAPVTAFSAAKFLLEGADEFEFLPPRISRLQRTLERISSRSALWLGGAAGALIAIVALVFAWQGYRLSSMEGEWSRIGEDVEQAGAMQDKIREFRPWFDDTAPTLVLLRNLTEAFPEDGAVWVRKIEIKNGNLVICNGNARSNRDLLALLDALRKNPNVEGLQTSNVHGSAPVVFSLNFSWKKGTGDGV